MNTTNTYYPKSSSLVMDGAFGEALSIMEMREKQHFPLSFLGRRAIAPRPLSDATEIFDTDNEEDSDQEYSTPRSLESLDNGSQSTASTPDMLHTPNSGGLGGFEFHFDEKLIRGPSGPHLFRASPDIERTGSPEELELLAEMSPVVEHAMRVEMIKPIVLERPTTPRNRPFSSLNRAVAELDESQVRDWTPEQVANWMREAGFETSVVDKFLKHDISGTVLLDLQFEDLKELDITSYGKRHRVMSSIQHLRNSSMISLDTPLSRSNSKLERSNSKLERQPRVLQRAVQPEEAHILAYQTENGLKSRSSSSQRRGRHPKSRDDAITPAESVSIVAIEQLLPKVHKCSKGEDCPKWQKQQRKFLRVQEDFSNHATSVLVTEVKLSPTEQTSLRPKSDAVPSVVASSDVLGPSEMRAVCITPEMLSEVDARDPQENVRQFLSFQHMHSPSPANDPSPPPATSASFVPSLSKKSPPPLAEHLRSLPKLTIPLEAGAQATQPVTAVRTPISALHQPNRTQNHLLAQLQKDPYHYGGVASPADIYRVGTPYSATDIPVTSFPIDPLSRDVSQSVPPDMRYGSDLRVTSPIGTITDPIRRPSSIQPSPSHSRSRRHPRQPSFTPSVAPVSEFAALSLSAAPRPSQSSRHFSRDSRPLAPQTALPSRLEDVVHTGWMRKRRTTKLLRHEWQDNFFSLRGTQLAMHQSRGDALDQATSASPDATPTNNHQRNGSAKAIDYIDVDDYAIACSSLASSSKLSAAFKKSILGSNYRTAVNEQAFAFSLIPEGDKAKKLFAISKSHHFSVKSRDERIEWMRDLMLAKALKRARKEVGRNGEIRVDSLLI